MKLWTALALVAIVAEGQQQQYDIASCSDIVALTGSVSEDTILSFTASPVSKNQACIPDQGLPVSSLNEGLHHASMPLWRLRPRSVAFVRLLFPVSGL